MRILRERILRDLLPYVPHPAQYTGLEHNRRCGDVHTADVTVALAFPDAYPVGVSHLGTQILYTLLNATDGVACDRAYCPTPEAERVMRERGVGLFGWESRAQLGDFDVIGVSLSYEMVLTNMLTMLDLAGVPLHAAERSDADPIIVVGGTQADAPEVMAEFTDIVLVGDGEASLPALVQLVHRAKRDGAGREAILLEAARTLPEAYVPSLWKPRYHADGTLASLAPVRDDLPRMIRRGRVPLSASPPITHPLVPATAGVFDRISLEIMRGCPHGCRFCHAGATRHPLRWRSVDELVDAAQQAVDNTGFREISLLSLSTGNYPHLGTLMTRMNERFAPQHVSIAVPSLRVDKQLAHLPWQLNRVRKGGMTIAAEVGTDRLRRAIRKTVTNEDLINGVRAAYAAGWKSVKVYFMAGFPGETDADLEGIIELCRAMSLARKAVDGHKGSVTASISWFVPKPHTPLQWAPQASMDYFWHARRFLTERTRKQPITVKCHHIERSVLEAVIARGDRRLGRVVEAAWRAGARFDGWREHFDVDLWRRAFDAVGLDMAFYARRERPLDERLPWDMIAAPRSRDALAAEWRRYQDAARGG
ncbi:MAG: TIGR03960 family B12-binding radical SAM protein [Planctomycetota bacterium]